ncbi:MAG: hypothetical protein ABL904_17290 [Hyphomicrobiaceae bacterium]
MLSGSMNYKIDEKWSREKSDGSEKKNRFLEKIPSQNGTNGCEKKISSRSLAPDASPSASSGNAPVLSAPPVPPPAPVENLEKAARFQSQFFRKFGAQEACPDKIRPKVLG